MVDVPSPKECLGVVGMAVGVLGLLVSLPLLLIAPWGWYLLVASGTVAALSLLYCMIWEWDHIPP